MSALLEAVSLHKHFAVRHGALQRQVGTVRAVDGVSLRLEAGESFALVGESGCGKTTLGRCLLRLVEPTAGEVLFRGEDLASLSRRELRRRRKDFQMIFQDPFGSLNPRMSVARTLEEPLRVHRLVEPEGLDERVAELLETVGLPPSAARRRPHELSVGQRQRVGIARALATGPELLIADEPVSALDVSVQAQIINLLAELQIRLHLTLLFIGHDLAVVEQLADRVGVMYVGRLVEVGSCRDLFSRPQHPYTVSLLSAIPIPDPMRVHQRIVLAGEPPRPMSPPPGCRFHTRCPVARTVCQLEPPELQQVHPGHAVACHFPGELLEVGALATRPTS